MVSIKNMTPHEVRIVNAAGDCIKTFPSEGLARVTSTVETVGEAVIAEGVCVPLTQNAYGEVEGLPAPAEGLFYIVSRLVLSAVRSAGDERKDLLVPGSQVRNDQGMVIGCKSFDVE